MHPIDKVHEKISAGYVLNLYGEWVFRSVALSSKQQLLKHVFAGEVEVDGRWVALQHVRKMWSSNRRGKTIMIKSKNKDSETRLPVAGSGQEPVQGFRSAQLVQVEDNQLPNAKAAFGNGKKNGSNLVFKKTIQVNAETVLTISETEIQMNRVSVLALDGYLDQSTCKIVQEELSSRMNSDMRFFIFDFSHATLITSAGWGMLAGVKSELSKLQGDLFVTSMKKDVEESFRLLQFGAVLKSYSSNEECLLYLKSIVKLSMSEFTAAYVPNDKLMTTSGKILPQDVPLQEKVKAIIAQYGPVSSGDIASIMNKNEFGKEKIGIFKLNAVLREMNLDTKEKRERFYRSC